MSGNTQHMRLFRKSTSQTINCWTSVTCRAGDDKFISANMDVVFSNAAYEKFSKLCKESKNDKMDWVDAKVTSSWLKPQDIGNGKTKMALFVNDFEIWQADTI